MMRAALPARSCLLKVPKTDINTRALWWFLAHLVRSRGMHLKGARIEVDAPKSSGMEAGAGNSRMRKMSTKTKLFGALAFVGVLIVTAALPAAADQHTNTSTSHLTVTAGVGPRFDDTNGDGNFPVLQDFQPVALNGTPQLTSAYMDPFTVVDDSGTQAGWNVSLTVPDLQDGTGAGCATGATATLDASGTMMNPPIVRIGTDDTVITGVAGHGFTDFTTAQKIVTAAAGDGMGTYTISPQILKLIVPSQQKIGSGAFCTVATVAIASGP